MKWKRLLNVFKGLFIVSCGVISKKTHSLSTAFYPYQGELMKRRDEKCLKEKLAKKHACYVLITCDALDGNDGRMQIEMSYEGDATLAAYILHGAQLRMDEQEFDAPVPSVKQNKIHYFE